MSKSVNTAIRLLTAAFVLSLVFCSITAAEDWPCRLHDIRRGGITSDEFDWPIVQKWVKSYGTPEPAWIESPAITGQTQSNLKPRQNFDFCYDVAVVGDFLYFGSSRSGAVTCLDTATGSEVWTYVTDGPVRLAPHVADNKVYFGSDDGYAYCLDASDGSLIWSERAGPTSEMLWGNGHMISLWPVRSSVLVDGSDVFWTAGIFPREGMYICKRNAADGTGGWTATAMKPHQGYLLASSNALFAPSGKSFPASYSRSSGSLLGYFNNSARDGGCWALLSPQQDQFWVAPSEYNDSKQYYAESRSYIASVYKANYLIADSSFAYYNTDTQIIKFNRTDSIVAWSEAYAYPYALIKVGDKIITGGDGEIAVIESESGELFWTAPVDGKAYGLAAANGRLFVSTDTGKIYMFGQRYLSEDFNKNDTVDLSDLMIFLESFLDTTLPDED
ncbi:MAG: PQQ-binding-like beta-propeller repeat protein [Sedimentisphaerales bacterium]|nr:PQQ-binding-like beta-propeller repeat protein [Sedimentisphaerales bacterium]